MPIFLILSSIVFGFPLQALTANTPVKVIIDPGHGGTDHGAVYHGIKESEVNLAVGKILNRLLISDRRFKTHMTRTGDRHLSLEQRSHFAHKAQGDIFLSLHSNSFQNSKAKGVEFYFQNQLPPNEEAMFLASKENTKESSVNKNLWPLTPVKGSQGLKTEVTNIIQDLQLNHRILLSSQLAESLSETWRGQRRSQRSTIRQAPFHVISNVNMPSNLIEMGYLTNKKEARLLNSKSYQNTVANSIYKGLINYKDFMDKQLINDLN